MSTICDENNRENIWMQYREGAITFAECAFALCATITAEELKEWEEVHGSIDDPRTLDQLQVELL